MTTTGLVFAQDYAPETFWEAWWLSPGPAAAAAVLALFGVVITLGVQRNLAKKDRALRDIADQREGWWSRAQWALDLVINGDDRQVRAAQAFLTDLALSDLAGVHQAKLISAITDVDLDNYTIKVSNRDVIISPKESDAS